MAKEAKKTRKGGSVVLPKPADDSGDKKNTNKQKSENEGEK